MIWTLEVKLRDQGIIVHIKEYSEKKMKKQTFSKFFEEKLEQQVYV